MPSVDLTPYYQPQGSTSDGTKFDNLLALLQSTLNGLDANNFASGLIFAPSKIQQGGATTNQGLVWSGSAWAPAGTMSLICDQVLVGTQAGFDTSTILGGNIPQTFKHLKLIAYLRADDAGGASNGLLRFNADSAANYHASYAQGSNGVASSAQNVNQTAINNILYQSSGSTANRFTAVEIEIPHYTNTAGHKSAIAKMAYSSDDTVGNNGTRVASGTWKSTAAITQIQLLLAGAGNFIAGSRFSLYGIS